MKGLFKGYIIKAVLAAGLLGISNTVGMVMASHRVSTFLMGVVTAIGTVFSFALIFFIFKAIKTGEFRT